VADGYPAVSAMQIEEVCWTSACWSPFHAAPAIQLALSQTLV